MEKVVNFNFSWWRHQMETFSALLAICAGNSLITGEFPALRPVTRSFDVFFDLRLNKRLSKQSWGWWFETLSRPSWRHCIVYFADVIFYIAMASLVMLAIANPATGHNWCNNWVITEHMNNLDLLVIRTRGGGGGGGFPWLCPRNAAWIGSGDYADLLWWNNINN